MAWTSQQAVEPKMSKQSSTPAAKSGWFEKNRTLLIIVAVILGASTCLGLKQLGFEKDHEIMTLLALPGKLWLKGLKCVVLPMIIFSMIGAMVMMRSLPGARYLGVLVVGAYLFTTFVAAVEACTLSAMILGPFVEPMAHEAAAADGIVADMSLLDTVVAMIDNLVPKNVINDAAKDNLLPVIIGSIIFGLLVESKQEDGSESYTMRLVSELQNIVIKVITGLISIAPIGVGSLVFGGAADLDLAKMGGNIGALLLTVIGGHLLHGLVFYPTFFFFAARRNPIPYFGNVVPAVATALGTASSAATLPVSIDCAAKNGIPAHLANFVLNLGATINMDGATIYMISAVYFLGQLHGVPFGAAEFMMTVVLGTLCSMGSAPVPAAALVLMATMMTAVGIPVDETFGLIVAVDWILDRTSTALNITGDSCVVGVMDACSGLLGGKSGLEASESEV